MPATRSKCALRCVVVGCSRLARRRVDEYSAQTWKSMVLARHAGLRICGLGPALANPAVRRPGVLAVADVESVASGAAEARSKPFAADDVCGFEHRHSAVLRRRPDVRSAK